MVSGIIFELFLARAGSKFTKLLAKLCKGELQTTEAELGRVAVGEQVGEVFDASADFLAPDLFVAPGFKAAADFPFGDVSDAEVFAVFAEVLFDVVIFDAVGNQLVKLVADFFGEAADFASGTVLGRRIRGRERVDVGWRSENLRFSIHNRLKRRMENGEIGILKSE